MQTYTFVFDQPENEDQDQPYVVAAEGDGYQEAEMLARNYLRETTEITSGFRRTLIFRGVPLTPPDIDGGIWMDARPAQLPDPKGEAR
ncbi:hypothetical protein ACFFS2_30720 [Streptomyces aurantiacus]|uniref:Uncharacterized protein n=1 Tax=Streptomyces aurantiacus TaxID=47760 RepID=A0A7G1P3V5_9ACTN|nr:hypothetical protein [Streptomyces aurantiacus]BCL28520.1 hypothetical protein GCM10017557_33790 [Streptomyces aurantiacus]